MGYKAQRLTVHALKNIIRTSETQQESGVMLEVTKNFDQSKLTQEEIYAKELSVWYQVHSNYILFASDYELTELYAIIQTDMKERKIVAESYTNDKIKAAVMSRIMRFDDLSNFEDAVIREIETMQKEYDDGESGELPVHEQFGQAIFWMDDSLYL